MHPVGRISGFLAGAVVCGYGQPPLISYRGLFNAASLMPAGLAGGAVARGSIFLITGKNLSSTDATPDLSDPLQTVLGGVSVTVTQGSTTVNAIPLVLTPTGVSAIMPSNAPLGAASVRIIYKNVTSNPMPVRIVATQYGIYTANGAGNGPAMAAIDNGDGTTTPNTLQTPASPGQTVYLSGTGLGAISTDTALLPNPGNLTVATEVFVGGLPATVSTKGRSGPGTDKIGFVVPDSAPLGCWTPVYVKTAGGNVSNFATISSSADGSPCQEPNNVLSSALINGGNIGSYAAARINVRHDAGVRTPRDATSDVFGAYEAQEVAGPANFNPMFSLPPAGSCTAYTVAGDLIGNPLAFIAGMVPPTGKGLDNGGGASLTGDKGTRTAQKGDYPGISGARLGSAAPALPLTQTPFLNSGGLTLGLPGGDDIGNSSTDTAVPTAFTWTNRDQILSVPLSKGLNITWSGGDPAASVFVVAANVDLPTNSTALTLCIAPAGTSNFTVPADAMANLPVTRLRAIQSKGAIYVGQWNLASPTPVAAAGLDFGALLPIFVTGKTVRFQ